MVFLILKDQVELLNGLVVSLRTSISTNALVVSTVFANTYVSTSAISTATISTNTLAFEASNYHFVGNRHIFHSIVQITR